MTNKKLLLLTFFSGLFLVLITEPSLSSIHRGYFRTLEAGLLSPLFFTLVFYFISSFVLLFFSNKIFKLWLRKIVSWFLPVSAVLIWGVGSGGNSYVVPSSSDFAITAGIILTIITLIFALIQKYKYKR